MSKYIFNNIDSRARIVTQNAKRRPSMPGDESGIKAPSSYFFHNQRLISLLEKLIIELNHVQESESAFFEAGYFPDELSSDYISLLSNQAGIRKVKKTKINNTNLVDEYYFQITNKCNLIEYLTISINELTSYVNEEISKDEFNNKRIILWKYFSLLTPGYKRDLLSQPANTVKINIETIELLKTKTIIQSLTEFNILPNTRLNGLISYNPEELFEDLTIEFNNVGYESINSWITELSSNSKIGAIRLNPFMSRIEDVTTGGETLRVDIDITVPSDLPVIAVVDSGVKSNVFTRDILTEDGLDYTQNDPINGDPFEDLIGHGTAVAGVIAYGDTLKEYLLEGVRGSLVPVAKIFPVRVFYDANVNKVRYEEIFEIGGLFGQKIIEYGIKIINLSLGALKLSYTDFSFSEISKYIDSFSSYYNVTCIISSGNILPSEWENLNDEYSNLSFLNSDINNARLFKKDLVNATSPSEALSGISVGSLYEGSPALHSRSFPKIERFPIIPDVLSIGGGDYIINTDGVITGANTVFTCDPNETILTKNIGTSFSAPRITRLAAICQKVYPGVAVTGIKAIILSKTRTIHPKKYSIIQGNKVLLDKSILGGGSFKELNEIEFLKDSENEFSYIIKGKISSQNIVDHEIPIDWVSSLLIPNTNNIGLKLSLCMMPVVKDGNGIKTNNIFHCAAMMHPSNISVLCTKTRGNKEYRGQMLGKKDPGVLVPWTCDYSGNGINPTFSESQNKFTKENLLRILSGSNQVKVSIRGLCAVDSEIEYSIIVHFEDLGATNQLHSIIDTIQISL